MAGTTAAEHPQVLSGASAVQHFSTPLWLSVSCLFVLFSQQAVRAGLAPESVLLVVNADREASVAVAREYARLRSIPAINMVSLTGVTNVEQLPVAEFREQILAPVLRAIDDRGLRAQIQCVAYSVELPTAIHVQQDIGDRKLPPILTPVASLNGLTYLYRMTMSKDIRYLDLNTNFYSRRVMAVSRDTPWRPDELSRYANAISQLQEHTRRKQIAPPATRPADALLPVNDPGPDAAINALMELRKAHPEAAELLYNLACSLAVLERTEEALSALTEAVNAGWFDHRHTARDPDLSALREMDGFKALLRQMSVARLDVQPARGFRSDLGWLPSGESTERDDAPRYLMSTVLGVTTGRGLSVDEVIANLRRSAGADGTRPQGTVYYLKNGDVRSTTHEWGFVSAVDKLKSLGVQAVVDDGILPVQKPQVAGAMVGIADFDWARSESQILPGAIVEHLTSFGGVMTAGAGQTPLTEFLRHGAAGASGTVTEPYALQGKFPNPFIHVHYASGCSLAEAFYQSVTGPYQLLIVGDPLCTPWRRDFTVNAQPTSRQDPWSGKVVIAATTESREGLAAKELSLFVDGVRHSVVMPGRDFELDTSRYADGDHQITILGRANDAVETTGRWTARVMIRN